MIEVKNLTKTFDTRIAVNDVSFTVDKGEILGFLGPNGAGKSTTMRMITGFIPPTRGTAVIGGADIREQSLAAREKIGYLPENAPVYSDMSVTAYLSFCASIRGFTGADNKRKVAETIDKCFLKEVHHQTIQTLSKGYKQRVCFAQSILHDPAYLIMDEPTDGLDPNQKHEVRLMIRDMSADKAIILSTHILDEVDAVCDRAVIIADGAIIADDTPRRLRRRSALHGAVTLTLRGADPETVTARFRRIEGVKSVQILSADEGLLSIRIFPVDPQIPIAERVLINIKENNDTLETVFVEQGRLDEVFRDLTRGRGQNQPRGGQ
jgi:ABC-2 type transport system ATP-binding protein